MHRVGGQLEVEIVTGDGCDAVSWLVADEAEALESLRRVAADRAVELNYELQPESPEPMDADLRVVAGPDGHGLIVAVWPGEPVQLSCEFRYEIRVAEQ